MRGASEAKLHERVRDDVFSSLVVISARFPPPASAGRVLCPTPFDGILRGFIQFRSYWLLYTRVLLHNYACGCYVQGFQGYFNRSDEL